MANYYAQQPPPPYGNPQQAGGPNNAQNLQFYQSSYGPAGSSGTPNPGQNQYGYGGQPSGGYGGGAQGGFTSAGFSGAAGAGLSGRMGEQGGLRTGWLAAFSTEGYETEPPLLEELGVNFGHIQMKVRTLPPFCGECNSMAEGNALTDNLDADFSSFESL